MFRLILVVRSRPKQFLVETETNNHEDEEIYFSNEEPMEEKILNEAIGGGLDYWGSDLRGGRWIEE